MEVHKYASNDELQSVFQMCDPNSQGLISLKKLQELFEQHQDEDSMVDPSHEDLVTDQWINFDEFCQGVRSFYSPMIAPQTNLQASSDPFDSTFTAAAAPSSAQHHHQQPNIASSDFSEALEEETLIDFTSSPPSGNSSVIKVPKLILPQDEFLAMTSHVDSSGSSANPPEDPRIASPQSTTDSAIGGSTSPEEDPPLYLHKRNLADSSFSDEKEENFESYGENEDVEYEAEMPDFDEVDVAASPRGQTRSPNNHSSISNDRNFVRRNAWMRTSLRRSPAQPSPSDQLVPPRRWGSFRHPTKRVGSNALASALYYNNGASASFNSSGRSSNCDEGDMQSDISLEEDVNDLNHKVQMLQEQVGHLAESQANTDDRYSKVKQENASLTQKVHMLEEHIREVELQSQERLIDEQKRNKELLQRLEREKTLEIENYAIRLQSAERDQANAVRDLAALRSQVDRLKTEKGQLEQELFETQQNYTLLQKECARLEDATKKMQEQLDNERSDNAHLVEELTKEADALRARLQSRSEEVISDHAKVSFSHDDPAAISRVKEMENELKSLQNENRKLKEDKEDLQAQVINGGVIAGRNVLLNTASMSIADELGSLSDQQIRNALKEQQDVNTHLRGYIDGILTNIMEKYPELLEVKK